MPIKNLKLLRGAFRIFRKRVHESSFLSELSSKWTEYRDLWEAVVLCLLLAFWLKN